MPLTITIPGRDFYDQRSGLFLTTNTTTLSLEHSLLSLSKWESKWHKPFLSSDNKTEEENIDYIRCMCITKNVDSRVFRAIDQKTAKEISDYIVNPMTATTINRRDMRSKHQVITNELIYFWMSSFGIPFDPCEKWHLNRLLTLIEVASIKNSPPKKMGKREMLNQRQALNAQRRAKYHTSG